MTHGIMETQELEIIFKALSLISSTKTGFWSPPPMDHLMCIVHLAVQLYPLKTCQLQSHWLSDFHQSDKKTNFEHYGRRLQHIVTELK